MNTCFLHVLSWSYASSPEALQIFSVSEMCLGFRISPTQLPSGALKPPVLGKTLPL